MCVFVSLSLSLSLIYLSATALTDSLSIQLIELTSALVPRPRSLDRPSLSLSFCAIHLRLSGIRLSDQMEQPWKATVEAGAPAAAAAAASRLSKPISSLSLSLSLFCLNSSRDKHQITSNLLQNRMGRRGERERREGGLLSSRKEDYHRRKNDSGIQPCAFRSASSSSLSLVLPFCSTQNDLLLDSALEFQQEGEDCC